MHSDAGLRRSHVELHPAPFPDVTAVDPWTSGKPQRPVTTLAKSTPQRGGVSNLRQCELLQAEISTRREETPRLWAGDFITRLLLQVALTISRSPIQLFFSISLRTTFTMSFGKLYWYPKAPRATMCLYIAEYNKYTPLSHLNPVKSNRAPD